MSYDIIKVWIDNYQEKIGKEYIIINLGQYLIPFIDKYREEPIKEESNKGRLAAQLEAIRKMLLALKQKIYEYIKHRKG